MGRELLWVGLALVVAFVLGAALLRFVPRKTSRAWATGLMIVAMLNTVEPLIGVVIAQFSPPSFYLQTEKNRLEFNRDETGAVFGVTVNNPPPECLTYLQGNRATWQLALGTITLTLVALLLWLRVEPREAVVAADHADQGAPSSQPRPVAS
jgi:hypothetical protein